VYERDPTRGYMLFGYRIDIDPDGSRALHECLPEDLYATFMATCAKTPQYFNILTEHLQEVLSIAWGAGGADPVNSEKVVSRMTLRQILLTGLEDVVHFGKTFTRYETDTDGNVTAFFEDGSSATGTVLVGADGTNSRVRRGHLPHAQLANAGLIAITGKVALTGQTRALLTPKMLDSVSRIIAPHGYSCVLHIAEFPWDESGAPKADTASTAAALIASWPGLSFDNSRDYVMWGFAGPATRLPAGVMDQDSPSLRQMVERLTTGWHPHLRELFAHADPDSCFPVNIRTSEPVPPWPSSNVTLIGDAIHTMTPGRGVGANTALRDARLLARNLVGARDGHATVLQAIGDYEAKMRVYSSAAVKQSLKQMNGFDLVNKPVIGRAVLAGRRTGMRIVNHLPPVKERMEKSQREFRGYHRGSD
jgi:2-polyprenyl-6-methoxyphenol hydroxylase-like FAD-dependent oxidoreductase